jgi:hypothetical protein
MENLREILKQKNISITLRYYGKDDLGTGWDIKAVVENPDVFGNYSEHYSLDKLESLDDYYIYLMSLKLAALADAASIVKDEYKNIVLNVASEADKVSSGISNGEVISFINKNIAAIFDKELSAHEMRALTIDLIVKFSSGISAHTYEYLVDNYNYMLIDRYSDFEKIFEADSKLFSRLIPDAKLENIMVLRLDTVLSIFEHISNSHTSNLKSIVEDRIEELYKEAVKIARTMESRNIIQNENIVRKFYAFLNNIKSPLAGSIKASVDIAQKKMDEYLKQNGQSFSYEIPVNEILERWRKSSNWEVRLLTLTHDVSVIDEKCVAESRLAKYEKRQPTIVDLVSSNISTDDFYTVSHQQELGITASIEIGTMLGIIANDEYFQEYLNLISSGIKCIENELKIDDMELSDALNILIQMLGTIKANISVESEILRLLCYSASMYICSYMEKVLRLTYEYLAKGKIYVPSGQATLGNLLSVHNEIMVDIFGTYHIRHLMFFLSRDGDKKIGYNYRNKLAHLTGDIEKRFNVHFVAELLWLLTDVINTIFWKVLQNSFEGGRDI